MPMESRDIYPYIEDNNEFIRKVALFCLYGESIPKEIKNRYKASYEKTFKRKLKNIGGLIREGRFEEAIVLGNKEDRELAERRRAEVIKSVESIAGAINDSREKGNFKLFVRAIKILGNPANLRWLKAATRDEIKITGMDYLRRLSNKDKELKEWVRARIEDLKRNKYKKEILEDIELVLGEREYIASEFSRELGKIREEILRENIKRMNEYDGMEDKELEELIKLSSSTRELIKLKLISKWKEVDEGDLNINFSWLQRYKVRLGIAHYKFGKDEYLALVEFKRKTLNGVDGVVKWRDIYMVRNNGMLADI